MILLGNIPTTCLLIPILLWKRQASLLWIDAPSKHCLLESAFLAAAYRYPR